MKMKKISDWAKVLLPLIGSGLVLWYDCRHAVVLHKEVYHKPKY